ncbi:MAG TPA: zinc metallopeptidase [Baekduia sp.]|uniref:zinc metallopeptidase n=1 Tax=Baekduia sp. TaxID=2600305 RepID=UPI002C799889|nr:zinc metallopeptidase [Baekduia sp.]HMJ34953.1 zinc metallopeptidase [Baekduia sp.]
MSLTIVWLLTLIIPLAMGLWAQNKVKRTFARYSEVPVRSGMTGAQAAAAVVRASGLPDVEIRAVQGTLTDHYDPRSRTLNLSPDVGQASSVAALGVAAHEAGHAIQDARNYLPMRVRQTFVPVASIGSNLAIPVIFVGLILGATGLTTIGLALFTAIVAFQLITLPVEFDASRRALVALNDGRLLEADELDGAKSVLSAAAWTYVAAFVASLSQLIYFFLASRR